MIRSSTWTHLLVASVMVVLAWLPPRRAHAYAWMIRHEYAGCAQCHADPSGGGLLTLYGRAQGEILLRSHYSKGAETEEPGAVGGFLFGAVPLPESVLVGGDYRGMYLYNTLAGSPATSQLVQMQADVEGQVTFGRVRLNGSLGYDHGGAEGAWITSRAEDNLVSRVYWAGIDLGEDKSWLLRAGRMNIPFGIRSIEHTLFIHSPPMIPGGGVGDDTNTGQELGVALAYNGEHFRGEVMAIVGNYQESPDAFRQRGYSGYVEWDPTAKLALGVSSLVTESQDDPILGTALVRQAHGVFARAVAWKPLTILVEEDLLVDSQPASAVGAGKPTTNVGHAGMLQADVEPWQGLHLMVTGEMTRPPVAGAASSFGIWASAAWFFLPHVDVRVDAIQQSLALAASPLSSSTLLLQLHAFL